MANYFDVSNLSLTRGQRKEIAEGIAKEKLSGIASPTEKDRKRAYDAARKQVERATDTGTAKNQRRKASTDLLRRIQQTVNQDPQEWYTNAYQEREALKELFQKTYPDRYDAEVEAEQIADEDQEPEGDGHYINSENEPIIAKIVLEFRAPGSTVEYNVRGSREMETMTTQEVEWILTFFGYYWYRE